MTTTPPSGDMPTAAGDSAGRIAPADPAGDPQPVHFTHRQIVIILLGVMSGMFLAALDQGIVGTALPRIVSELGGLDKLSWVVTAYLLTSTAVTPLWGKLSDLYGRRLIFQTAIGIFLLGSALSGLSQNMEQLIGFRALQGVGGGGLFAIALAIIGDVIPPRERGRYQGYFGAVFGVSSIAGPLLGGWFTDGPGWRWIFYVNLPIGLAALVVTSLVLKMPVVRREHSIDYLGAVTVVAAVTSLLLYLDWRGRDYGWGEPWALALLGLAIALSGLFILIERRAAEPILPLRLFRDPVFSVASATLFLAGCAFFAVIVFTPTFLQLATGATPTESGLLLLPLLLSATATTAVSGRVISRTGRYKAFPVAGLALMTAGLVLMSGLSAGTSVLAVSLMLVVFGIGFGMFTQVLVVAVQNAADRRDIGIATASTNLFRALGGSIGVALFGSVFAARLDDLTGRVPRPEAVAESLGTVFTVAAPIAAAALLCVLALREVPLRRAA
jgi:EmrB/QacA subfamily drug resistance transporter